MLKPLDCVEVAATTIYAESILRYSIGCLDAYNKAYHPTLDGKLEGLIFDFQNVDSINQLYGLYVIKLYPISEEVYDKLSEKLKELKVVDTDGKKYYKMVHLIYGKCIGLIPMPDDEMVSDEEMERLLSFPKTSSNELYVEADNFLFREINLPSSLLELGEDIKEFIDNFYCPIVGSLVAMVNNDEIDTIVLGNMAFDLHRGGFEMWVDCNDTFYFPPYKLIQQDEYGNKWLV